MRCYKCKADVSKDSLGIFNPEKYYRFWSNLDQTIGSYADLDRASLPKRALATHPRVLLAGCACENSVWEFGSLFPNNTEIVIVDLNDSHFANIIERTKQWRPNLSPRLQFIQGDLKDVRGKFAYIRMDFTLNCMPWNSINPVLSNIKSCLAPSGVIASTVEATQYPTLKCTGIQHSLPFTWEEKLEIYAQAGLQVRRDENIFAWQNHHDIDEYGCDDIVRTHDLIGSFSVLA